MEQTRTQIAFIYWRDFTIALTFWMVACLVLNQLMYGFVNAFWPVSNVVMIWTLNTVVFAILARFYWTK